MLRKLLTSTALFLIAFCVVNAQTPAQRAQTKINSVVAYIDSKITDVPKKLNANEKKGILQAYTEYETGQDSLKLRRENLKKGKTQLDFLVNEVNTKTTALNQKGTATVGSQEEADKINAEVAKEKEVIEAKKAEITKLKESLAAEQGALKLLPEELESKRDEAVKKALAPEKAKIFEQMRAEQKAKKKS